MATRLRTKIERRLREAGLKVTPQRLAVLEYFARQGTHSSPDEIVARLQGQASRATVYNVLRDLAAKGLIAEVRVSAGVTRYEVNSAPHHHFICRACGRLEDVPAENVQPVGALKLKPGYRFEQYEVVIRGLCRDCTQPRPRKK